MWTIEANRVVERQRQKNGYILESIVDRERFRFNRVVAVVCRAAVRGILVKVKVRTRE